MITASEIGIRGGMTASVDDPSSEEAVRQAALVTYWKEQLTSADKREKDYRKSGAEVVRLYEGEKGRENQFNILYSNVETMAPALYNSTPRPIVKRRYLDKDPLGLLAAKFGERLLSFLLDDGGRQTTDFSTAMEAAVQAALVPGRGIPWVDYQAKVVAVPPVAAETMVAEEAAESGDPAEDPTTPAAERVEADYICVKTVPWDQYREGYGKSWQEVPWIARELFMTKEDLIENFGAEIGAAVEVQERAATPTSEMETGTPNAQSEGMTGEKTAQVFQIWDKGRKKVLHICPDYCDRPLAEADDPYGLDGFYPCPEPLVFFRRLTGRLPQTLYVFYEEQAKELNRITIRISKIITALKVRGFYDSALGEVKEMLTADDNTLIPVQGAAVAGANGASSLDKAIWLMPIEKLIAVLQQLYLQRSQVKQVIYEITGISDILRGASVASETATAQEIKTEWGGLRLKRSQKAVQWAVRDTLRIMLELAVSKLDPVQLKAMTGTELPMAAEKAQMQEQAQAMAMGGQQPPPELIVALQKPSFEDILTVLKTDLQRKYRIDIETNSTVDAEATEDKKDIAEMMNAMSQFLSGVAPMVENGSLPFEAAQAMLLAVTRRYRFGSEVEEKLMEMKAPTPTQGSPEAEKAMKEAQAATQAAEKATAEAQKAQEAVAAAQTKAQMELDFARKEFELEKAFALKELELTKRFAMQEVQQEIQAGSEQVAAKEQLAAKKQQVGAAQLADNQRKSEKNLESGTKVLQDHAAMTQELLATFTKAITEAVKGSGNKRAVKQKDGSWVSETITT